MHVMAVIGTRPEAVKMAPVVQALRGDAAFDRVSVCLTAQHRAMCDQVVRLFRMDVDYDLNVMTDGQTVFDVTRRVLDGMGAVYAEARPDVVLVHGDTTTTFAAALAAYYHKTAVGHVEAGLRTYDKYSPFPEEMNRRLCDSLCDYHYAPTVKARENLLREGFPEESVVVTGNTVIDALLFAAEQPCDAPIFDQLDPSRKLMIVTAHRRESFGPPLLEICQAVDEIIERNADVEALLPMHPNPHVREVVEARLGGRDRILLTEPLDYLPFVHLLKRAYLALTDSGGIQEEAPALGLPVLVMRDVTERPEAVEAGAARLVGPHREAIVREAERLIRDPDARKAMTCRANPYGDGKAAARIVEHLRRLSVS